MESSTLVLYQRGLGGRWVILAADRGTVDAVDAELRLGGFPDRIRVDHVKDAAYSPGCGTVFVDVVLRDDGPLQCDVERSVRSFLGRPARVRTKILAQIWDGRLARLDSVGRPERTRRTLRLRFGAGR